MSYPRELDEFSDAELANELHCRADRRERGLCDYCCRDSSEPPCRFPLRHRMAQKAPKTPRARARKQKRAESPGPSETDRTAGGLCPWNDSSS